MIKTDQTRFGNLQIVSKLEKGWLCQCDCGNEKFIKSLYQLVTGHNKSCGCLISKSGTDNAGWKGDKVGNHALHAWVKRNRQKPEACDLCGESKKLDLANISQQYKRDLTDWEWLCRRCHMEKDGRLKWAKRSKRGIANPRVLLTEDQVLGIRVDKRSTKTIAAQLGVSKSAISHIRYHKTWTHL